MISECFHMQESLKYSKISQHATEKEYSWLHLMNTNNKGGGKVSHLPVVAEIYY